MNERITVAVTAFDPISQAGIASQLRHRHEVSLVDGPTPGAIGLVVVDRLDEQATQAIRAAARQGSGRVVVVAAHVDSGDLLSAVEAGCCGLLRRVDATPDRLVTAVRAATAGDGTLPPDLLGKLLEQVGRLQREALAPRGLTASGLSRREISVLKMVAEGEATCEIAKQLSYSERTVKNILRDVTTRLQLRNRTQAVAYAVREGLI
ncbi:MAG: DNA-binding response regulator [Micromonosporaceae bacterium]|nr:DNA-binding response regulator [Micromonosporaceae bacterium]